MTKVILRPSANYHGYVWLEVWVDGKCQERTLFVDEKSARKVARAKHRDAPVAVEKAR